MRHKKEIFFEGLFTLFIPLPWSIIKNDEELDHVSVVFPIGGYPKLGIHCECIDDPKAVAKDEVSKYLNQGVKFDKEEYISKEKDIFSVHYKVNIEGDNNLKVWRIINVFKKRTIRIITIGLSWPDNKEANDIINNYIKEIDSVIKNISFSETTVYMDEKARAARKIKELKLEKIKVWDGLYLNLPRRWEKNIDSIGKKAKFKISGVENSYLFIDYDTVDYPINYEILESDIMNIAKNIAEDAKAKDLKVDKSGSNEYLLRIEGNEEKDVRGNIIRQYFWHRFIYKKNIIEVVNFILLIQKNNDYIESEIKNMLNQLIRNADFS